MQAASAARVTPKLQRVLARSVHYTHRRSVDAAAAVPGGQLSTSGRLQAAGGGLVRTASVSSAASGALQFLHGDAGNDAVGTADALVVGGCLGDGDGDLLQSPHRLSGTSHACGGVNGGGGGGACDSAGVLDGCWQGAAEADCGAGGGGNVHSPMLGGRRFQPAGGARLARIPSGMTMRPDESDELERSGGSGRTSAGRAAAQHDCPEQEHGYVQLPGEAPRHPPPAPRGAGSALSACATVPGEGRCGLEA